MENIKAINMNNVKMFPIKVLKVSSEQLFKSGHTLKSLREVCNSYGMTVELVGD